MTAPLAEGVFFAGRYRIVRLIAHGGMGAVYEVVHTETNRRRALKIMHPHIFESDDMRERFKREARVAADVETEHIVDVSDAGVDESTHTPFMVMELLRGEELGKRIKRVGALPAAEVLSYLRQTAIALDKTHAASIVHRDLKPDNLFLTHRDDGSARVKILDFGVAKVVAEGATGHATQNLGTPLYMAPEQFNPGARVLPAADIFALGLVAFTLLVGIPYWRPESTSGLIAFISVAIHGPKESPVERAAASGVHLPRAFDAWFFKATAFNSENRFGAASEAVAALEKVFAGASEAELLVTAPLPRPPAPSVPALGTTPGTFVPTAFPREILEDAALLDEPKAHNRRSRQTPVFMGIGLAIVGLLAVVVWFVVRTFASAPAQPVHVAKPPPVASTTAAVLPTAEPAVEPASTPVAEAPAVPSAAPNPPEPPPAVKPTVKPMVATNAPPPPRPPEPPPPAKPPTNSLIGQD